MATSFSIGKFHITPGNVIGSLGVLAGWVTAHAALLPTGYSTVILTVAGLILSVSNSVVKHADPAVSSTDAQTGGK